MNASADSPSLLLQVFGFLFLMVTCGCGAGYQYENGSWVYVIRNAAVGRKAVELPADDATFEVVLEGSFLEYAKDKSKVFIDHQVLEGADPSSFEVIDEDGIWCKDLNSVWANGQPVLGADPATFEIIQSLYARDLNSIYCGNVRMNVEELDDFEVVQADTGMGMGTSVPWALLLSFGPEFEDFDGEYAVTCNGWARDGASYYYGPATVEGEDYETFHPIDGPSAADKDSRFYGPMKTAVWEQWRDDVHRRERAGEFN